MLHLQPVKPRLLSRAVQMGFGFVGQICKNTPDDDDLLQQPIHRSPRVCQQQIVARVHANHTDLEGLSRISDLSAKLASIDSDAPVTASAASRPKPPRKIVSFIKTACSSAESSRHDCANITRRLRWRSGTFRSGVIRKSKLLVHLRGDLLAGHCP